MENEVRIPDLRVYRCPRCARKAVSEVGSTLLCQPCVNEFLARNVGIMNEFIEEDPAGHAEEVVPLPPMPPQGGDV